MSHFQRVSWQHLYSDFALYSDEKGTEKEEKHKTIKLSC